MKKGIENSFLTAVILLFILSSASVALADGGADLEAQIRALMEQNRKLAIQNRELSNRFKAVEKDMEKIKQQEVLKPKSQARAKEMDSAGQKWYEHFGIGGGVTCVVQATANNGDNNPEGGDHADGAYTMDLNLDVGLENSGNFFVHLEGGDGEGLNNNVPSFSVPNYDAYATLNNMNQADLTISEAFYEKNFFNDMFTFDIGKMDVSVLFDENDAAGDETTQFLSNIFVKSMGLTVPEPDEFYCPATTLTFAPAEILELRVIAASVSNKDEHTWEDIFSNGFIAGQVNFKPNFLGRGGNYRFYGWYDSRRHLDNSRLEEANINPSSNYERADEGQAGWGLSFDQEIAEGLTFFVRYSWTEDDLSVWNDDGGQWEMIPFNQVYSIGMGVSGMPWNRTGDNIGIAFGQTILTNDYKEVNSHTSNEKYLETYYRFVFNKFVALSADFQWTQNPGGSSEADDVFIFGLRSQINF